MKTIRVVWEETVEKTGTITMADDEWADYLRRSESLGLLAYDEGHNLPSLRNYLIKDAADSGEGWRYRVNVDPRWNEYQGETLLKAEVVE